MIKREIDEMLVSMEKVNLGDTSRKEKERHLSDRQGEEEKEKRENH